MDFFKFLTKICRNFWHVPDLDVGLTSTYSTNLTFWIKCEHWEVLVMSTEADKQMTVIATLSVNAPNNEIRDCIRKYNPLNTTAQHKKCFGGTSTKKELLASTLEYLGIKIPSSMKKDALASMLITRIQVLLPDTCVYCKQDYCSKPNDTPFLICRLCGQGSHDECIRDEILKIDGKDILDDSQMSRAEALLCKICNQPEQHLRANLHVPQM